MLQILLSHLHISDTSNEDTDFFGNERNVYRNIKCLLLPRKFVQIEEHRTVSVSVAN